MKGPDRRGASLHDDLLRRFATAIRGAQLYSPGHPLVGRNVQALVRTLEHVHNRDDEVVVAVIGNEIVVNDVPQQRAGQSVVELMTRLARGGIERVVLERGVTQEEVEALINVLAHLDPNRDSADNALESVTFTHIRVGRLLLRERMEGVVADTGTMKEIYRESVQGAESIWHGTTGTLGEPQLALTLVNRLAQAVAQNRSALLAISAAQQHDNYTFTHMVNVSVLTMAQARSLGIEGTLLREIGLAALLHDIGKVRTPAEILTKPDALTPAEFAIIRRHPIEGAEILRRTKEIPHLAAAVAFEHHLEPGGGGYPQGAYRESLNLGTMFCCIADVFDAMRSQRKYQQVHSTERVLAVLSSGGRGHDPNLVRRFVRLIGIYPAGSVVRLDTGATAVVVRAHAPDPYRPLVRVVKDPLGRQLASPVEVALWAKEPGGSEPSRIERQLEASVLGSDPLTVL
jgi:putative nucleotidyltransferase with HDIG domain